ncbi:conserved membrane hypothetical protein [Candidatus Methylobacter favarea]|uniref:Uncharacterized protein n=1 Tax=Candidatus Methylobacter favarea TaxID=2707345 RepID=A0A8S0WA20_9GAMM|nr:hypothetical protein [Candidatus Methylobacter favarea]CAA9890419.1 conserved membrane hypothetical protein [Candidatus Methylobacter favarea]
MLLLAKIAGIIVLVWFYMTAKEKGEQPFKWAIIGLIGYWLTWWIVNLSIVSFLRPHLIENFTAVFILAQVPALCAIGAAVLIRKKLLADVAEANKPG